MKRFLCKQKKNRRVDDDSLWSTLRPSVVWGLSVTPEYLRPESNSLTTRREQPVYCSSINLNINHIKSFYPQTFKFLLFTDFAVNLFFIVNILFLWSLSWVSPCVCVCVCVCACVCVRVCGVVCFQMEKKMVRLYHEHIWVRTNRTVCV